MRWLIWALGVLLAAEAAMAKGFEVDLDLGRVRESGDLTTSDSPGGLGGMTGILWFNQGQSLSPAAGGYSLYLSLNFAGMKLKSGAGAFPFASDRDFSLFRSVFMVNPCFLNDHSLKLCFGIGWQQLAVAQEQYIQSYGSGLWQMELRHHFAGNWTGGFRSSWSKVDQEVAGVKSFFELWTNSLFLGYFGW